MAGTETHAGMGGKKHGKKRVVTIVGLVLLVVVVATAAGVGVRWLQREKRSPAGHTHPGEVHFAKEVTDAQKLVRAGDYDKAHETINKALKDSSLSAQDKHDLYIQEGVTYENQKKYDAAMESFRRAASVKESLQAVQSIANLAAKKGDKEEAIKYYKKAVILIPNDPPQVRDNTRQYFENMIIYLEGGQPKYE